jgi:flavin reductase (DIM6/NTAB) family NADH-FMN oxidoreductase RutF
MSATTVAGEVSAFADAMSELAGGVVVVTCLVGGRPWGVTVTAFHSVSLSPPTVLVSLESDTLAAGSIAADGRFGVSVLAAAHRDVARYASVPGALKYLEAPEVEGALAHLECEIVDDIRVADHTVFVGRVLASRVRGGAQPLVYHRRDYRTTLPEIEGDRHAC